MIIIKDLHKSFSNKKNSFVALENINLDILEKDIFGIIGVSGAGKSTLLRCMCMLETDFDGEITIDNFNTKKLARRERLSLKKEIGVISQNYNLLMQKNVIQNVAFPLELSKVSKNERLEKAEKMLELVGLSDKKSFYPSQLSGGQKQRVAIARALITNPKILLCDEPTSALDSITTNSILSFLKDINQKLNITIVIITHNMEVVKSICNKVAIIDGGNIIENDTCKNIIKNPKSDISKLLFQKYCKEVD